MGSRTEICLICLRNNYNDKSLILFDLSTTEWENITYLKKLENFLNAEIMIYESTSICSSCLNDLHNAYSFKERVVRALNYWTVRLEENVNTENKQGEQLESSKLGDNNISELSGYNEDTLDISGAQNQIITEPETTQILNSDNKNDYFDCSKFPCDKCNYIFLTASELIHHSCDISSATSKSVEEPKPKKRTKNQKSDVFNCNLCELFFNKRWKLNKHLKEHTEDKKYVCTFCNRAFKQSYHLREHITRHTGERNFSCHICGKTFQRLSSQRRHIRTHVAMPGEKSKKSPFLCNICGKSFPYSNGAQRHMRIHTGDRRYECNVCGRKFSQSTHLRVHLGRVHLGTGEKKYRCNTCGQAFSIKATLNKHINGHKNSKNDVKIFQSLEPNLSQTELRENDEEIKKNEFMIDELPLYDHQGFLVACNQ